jgi:hypothetical protein
MNLLLVHLINHPNVLPRRAFWNSKTDGAANVVWEDNRTIMCIMTVFGTAI